MSLLLEPERIAAVSGFGFRSAADGYRYRPTDIDEIRAVFDLARKSGRQIVLRGAGRSYGDASVGNEDLILDISRMNRILAWNAESGVIHCQAGTTIEGLWRATLEDGYWPPVVSGTMFPTLAGALAMNIHGKNNFCTGTLGEHVLELEVLFPTGELTVLTPEDCRFYDVVSGAGLLGVIVSVKLQMKKVHGGNLRVLAIAAENLSAQLEILRSHETTSDYMVGWVDCFARGKQLGRGQIHVARYDSDSRGYQPSCLPENQDLPDTLFGFLPKARLWRTLRHFNNRPGMRLINAAKFLASSTIGNRKEHYEGLVGFSFLLDYVPNWRNAYLPGGFIQYQSFLPKETAERVFSEQLRMQQDAKLESFLGVLKRHRPDRREFLFSHAVDGYSLALDFKVTAKNWPRLLSLAHQMNDHVIAAGGRFYFAKDSTLRPQDVSVDRRERFRQIKTEVDPEGLLTSNLARRLQLIDKQA